MRDMSITRSLLIGNDEPGELPPGPRMPSAAAGGRLGAAPTAVHGKLPQALRRYLHTARPPRRPWVFLSNPEDVGQVLTISPELVRAGAGEANPLLGPLLGPRSVMLLDEPEHMTHRRFMLPSFHGERMRGYGEMMVEVAREEIASWPVGEPLRTVAAHAGDQQRGGHACDLRQHRGRADGASARTAAAPDRLAQRLLASDAARYVWLALAGAQRALPGSDRTSRGSAARRRYAAAAPTPGAARGRGHSLDARAGLRRERLADDRAGAARRTDHAALRRTHRDLAVVGLRASAAPPREAGAPARGGARGRGGRLRGRGRRKRRCACARRCRWSCADSSSRCGSAATRFPRAR